MILLKIWRKIGPIGIWIGHFFLKKKVFVWVFKIHGGISLPHPNLGTPPPIQGCMLMFIAIGPTVAYCHVIYKNSNDFKNELKVINKPYSDDNNYLLWRFLMCSSRLCDDIWLNMLKLG